MKFNHDELEPQKQKVEDEKGNQCRWEIAHVTLKEFGMVQEVGLVENQNY
jgi:hypothetical protein